MLLTFVGKECLKYSLKAKDQPPNYLGGLSPNLMLGNYLPIKAATTTLWGGCCYQLDVAVDVALPVVQPVLAAVIVAVDKVLAAIPLTVTRPDPLIATEPLAVAVPAQVQAAS